MERCELLPSERWRIDAFELWCWRRLLKVPWIPRRSNQSVLKEINPEYSLEGLMLKLKLQYFGHLIRRSDSLEKTLMLGKIEGRMGRGTAEEQMVGWHHWLDGNEFEQAPELMMEREAWPAITCGGRKRVGHNWATEPTGPGGGWDLAVWRPCAAHAPGRVQCPRSVSALRLPPPSWISLRCAALLHVEPRCRVQPSCTRNSGPKVSGTRALHVAAGEQGKLAQRNRKKK